jgi:hypothetical protein
VHRSRLAASFFLNVLVIERCPAMRASTLQGTPRVPIRTEIVEIFWPVLETWDNP